MTQQQTAGSLRRIVTGHDTREVAKVLLDGQAPNVNHRSTGHTIVHVWNTGETPADIGIAEGIEDVGLRPHTVPPPQNGTRFVVIDFPPGNPPLRHRTETLDYAIVLEGEIEMDLDDSTIVLNAGDVLVQRGTYHSWANRGSSPARVAFVLVDAKPLGIGKAGLY
jgi:quercetin dioxygenase-like cupin family protein